MPTIELVTGQVTVVSHQDYSWLKLFPWRADWSNGSKRFYIRVHSQGPLMHRIIMQAKVGEIVDHINSDTFDNRRENLRICTKQQNCCNRRLNTNSTSGIGGVSWHSRDLKWQAYVSDNGKRLWLGRFDTKEEAVAARVAAQKKYYGEFANFHHLKPTDI